MARSKKEWIRAAASRRQQHLKACEAARRRRQAKNGQSRLLRLPAELRNRIYELVLPTDRILDHASLYPLDGDLENGWELVQYASANNCWGWGEKSQYLPNFQALQQLCRQVRLETMSILYGSNTIALFEDHWRAPRDSSWLASRDAGFPRALSQLQLSQLRPRFCPGCVKQQWHRKPFDYRSSIRTTFMLNIRELTVSIPVVAAFCMVEKCKKCSEIALEESRVMERTMKSCASEDGSLALADLERAIYGRRR